MATTTSKPLTAGDFKVADLSLAAYGRKEIELAGHLVLGELDLLAAVGGQGEVGDLEVLGGARGGGHVGGVPFGGG